MTAETLQPLTDLVDELTATIKVLAGERDDLIVLVAFMASEDYTAEQIAYAVEKPWKHEDLLADAHAALEATATS